MSKTAPLGTYFSNNFVMAEKYHAAAMALVIGVFLHISTVILFESNEGHKFNIRKLMVIILGVIIAYFV